jgi:4-amino-4-deoxy-L-arabinose transferase-like glycosyltransferase
MLMFDMLVTFFVLLALLGLRDAWVRGGARAWIQVGAAIGLGALAKGPVVLLAPLTVAVFTPWWGNRRPDRRWWLGFAGALAIAHVIALSWALPAARAGGEAYGSAILFSQTEERMVHSFAHPRPWWWYLPMLPVLLFPYSVWPPLWRSAVRLLRPRAADSGMRFCLAWTLPVLAALSSISGKQPHYLLPLVPGFALLAARLLDEPIPAPRRWIVAPPVAGLLLMAAALITAPFLAERLRQPPWVEQTSPAGGVLLAVAAILCLLLFERLCRRPAEAPVWFTLLAVAAFYASCMPTIRRHYDVAPIARYLATVERRGQPIGFVGIYHGQFHFPGRLARPFSEILPGAEWYWLAEHPTGKVVEDVRDIPFGVTRTDFTWPYRTGVLAVWGRPDAAAR